MSSCFLSIVSGQRQLLARREIGDRRRGLPGITGMRSTMGRFLSSSGTQGTQIRPVAWTDIKGRRQAKITWRVGNSSMRDRRKDAVKDVSGNYGAEISHCARGCRQMRKMSEGTSCYTPGNRVMSGSSRSTSDLPENQGFACRVADPARHREAPVPNVLVVEAGRVLYRQPDFDV